MAKVTSKLQITIPKRVADALGIEPGDELDLEPAGSMIRMVPADGSRGLLPVEERLRIFDESTARQEARLAKLRDEMATARVVEKEAAAGTEGDAGAGYDVVPGRTRRGWTRDEAYEDRLRRFD